jgi:hypothetical protein
MIVRHAAEQSMCRDANDAASTPSFGDRAFLVDLFAGVRTVEGV